ncbi:hypothetical protein WME73_29900 [Sorangium sp. So ce302]|uniref:hypothetical protein n=1 Tax=Sorangium sp. So ce302 TaxID=3133297 RepID=UPI003F5DF6C9
MRRVPIRIERLAQPEERARAAPLLVVTDRVMGRSMGGCRSHQKSASSTVAKILMTSTAEARP